MPGSRLYINIIVTWGGIAPFLLLYKSVKYGQSTAKPRGISKKSQSFFLHYDFFTVILQRQQGINPMKKTFKTRMSSRHARALRLYDELTADGTPATLAARLTAQRVQYSEARIWQLLRQREKSNQN